MGPDDQMMSDTRSEMAEKGLKDLEQEATEILMAILINKLIRSCARYLEQYIKGGSICFR